MFRFIFSLVPWWIFALFVATFAPLTLEFFEDYQRDQARMEQALASGPPNAIPVAQLDRGRTNAPFGEVQLDGSLRADLGVQSIYFSETQYNYVLLDGTGTGTLVAILIPANQAEVGLTSLVSAADSEGRVTVQGFLAPTRVGDISRRLARDNGISRELYVVEPYFGSRSDALGEQITDSRIIFFISLGLTAFFALMAAWRFRRWRKRRSSATQSQRPAREVHAEKQAKRPSQKAMPAGGRAQAVTPWGGSPSGSTMVQPQMVQPQSGKPQLNQPKGAPPRKQAKPVPEDDASFVPDFKSVFPHGGSAFRFKSADQIILQSFGARPAKRTVKLDD